MKKRCKEAALIITSAVILALSFCIKVGGQEPHKPDEGIYYNAREEPEETPEILIMPEGVPETVDKDASEFPVAEDEPEKLPTEEYISLGDFEVTAYSLAEGSGCGLTKSGTVPQLNYTVAVDPEVIPLGSVLVIDGIDYVAEDIGGLVKGKVVDIYVEDTQTALNYGRQVHEIFIKKTAPDGGNRTGA